MGITPSDVFFFFVIITSFFTVKSKDDLIKNNHEIKKLSTKEDFKQFVGQNLTTVVYVLVKTDDLKSEIFQLSERFSEAIEELPNYSADFAALICQDVPIEICSKRQGNFIQTFDKGDFLLEFLATDIFDYSSLLSHTLQLVLLDKVPIIQNTEEINNLITTVPNSDIILAYLNKIGTLDHLLFLKAAFRYNAESLKFAVTTDRTVVSNLKDSDKSKSQLYFFNCRLSECEESRIFLNFPSLTNFCERVLSGTGIPNGEVKDSLHETLSPYDGTLHHLFLFYDSNVPDQLTSMIKFGEAIQKRFYGQVSLYFHDINKGTMFDFGVDYINPSLPKPCLILPGGEVDFDALCYEHEYDFHDAMLEVVGYFKGAYVKLYKEDDNDQVFNRRQENDEDKFTKEVMTEDDPVMLELKELDKIDPIDKSSLNVLTKDSIYKNIEKEKLLFILFYLDVDVRSKAFLRHYAKAAKKLNNKKLAIVDCYDWTYLCRDEEIVSYPILRIYKNQKKIQYRGPLTEKAVLHKFYMYSAADFLNLMDEEDIKKFIDGYLPKNAKDFTDISILGLFDSNDSPHANEFSSLSNEFSGNLFFGFVKDTEKRISEIFNTQTPAVIVFNRNDKWRKKSIISEYKIDGSLKQFIVKNSEKAVQEITIKNFPRLKNVGRPFLILFMNNEKVKNEDEIYMTLGELSFKGKLSNVIVSWMNTQESLSQKILSTYLNHTKEKLTDDKSYIYYVDFHEKCAYRYLNKVAESPLTDWMKKIKDETIKPDYTMTRKLWLPLHPGFDYLSLIRKEKLNELEKPPENGDDDYQNLDEPNENLPSQETNIHEHEEL